MSPHKDVSRRALAVALLATGALGLSAAAQAADYSQTETITYHDNPSKWVLGQVSKRVIDGVTVSEGTYDTTHALPLTHTSFGKLQQTLTWDTASTVTGGQRGTVKTVKDGNNNVTTLANWKRGIPQSITYADGTSESAVVSNDGTLASVTNAAGSKTCYAYDTMGRLSQVTYPSEASNGVCDPSAWNVTTQAFVQVASSEYGIGAGHWRQTVSTGNGRQFTYFDALWRPLVVREHDAGDASATQRFTRYAYDHDGRTTFASYPSTASNPTTGTRTTYDALGRVTRVEQDSELGVLATSTWYGNNADGPHSKVTNPRGAITRTWFQAFDTPSYDSPVTIWHPEGAYTHIARDTFGKPTTIRRSNSASPTGGTVALSRSYSYNANQELCRTVEPETGATLMGYDAAGNLAWSASGLPAGTACHATGDTTAISARRAIRTYDTRNRITSLSFPDNRGNTLHTYTADGLPATIEADNGDGNIVTTSYEYNRRRLPTRERMQWNSIDWSVTQGYNANGHLASQSRVNLSIDYAPNALGQPTQVGSYASNVSYFPNGAIKSFTYGNGIVHTLTQNSRGLPDTSTDAYGTTKFLSDSVDYDGNGNVAAITDGATGTNQRGNRDMSYDGLDRLTSTVSPMFGTATYAYDVLDNLTRVKIGGTATRDHHYCYDGSWRLTNVKTGSCSGSTVIGLGYDVQGNLANRNGQVFNFDYGNRLRGVNGVASYVYDGLGRRVRDYTTASKYSLYSQAGPIVFDSDVRKKRQHWYLYLGNSLVAVRERNTEDGTVRNLYQHTDALGSPVVITDANRTVLERREYEPYGKQLTPTPQDGVNYTGHVYDAATGLLYMQQRYMDPDVPRFLSVDPVTPYSSPVGQFNRYRYANGNPYKFVDPDGRVSDEVDRQPRDWRTIGAKSPGSAAQMATSARGSGEHSGQRQGSANIKYNADPPRTVPPSGENARALECTANCAGADELLVTGGAEQSGHSRSSLHYQDMAVDIVGPPFNAVKHGEMMWCAKACGYTHGGWEVNGKFYPGGDVKSSIYKDHWHFQIGGSGRVPPLPDIGFKMQTRPLIGVPRSPVSRGGMIGP